MLLLVLTGLTVIVLSLFIYRIRRSQSYWYDKDVPHLTPKFVWGNMENPFTAKYGLKYDLLEAHNEFKRLGYKHGGIYLATQPVYLIVDPDAIKTILIKDFKYFTDRGSSVNEKIDPLSVNLGNLEGERWKNMRAKLSPTFTSAKMKLMFDALLDCRLPMMNKLDEFCRNQREFDVKATMSCYTTDVIASCIFGLDSNSFENPNSKFKIYGGILIKPGIRTIIIQNLRLTIPNVMKIFRIKLIPIEVEQFFLNLVKNIFEYRTTNNVYRNDFVQMLLEEQEKLRASGQNPLSLEEIAAHSLGFFVSGFEPTSATITFCLHELAFNQDVQDKLRDEIRMSMEENGGKLSYDGVMGMKYLDQVMNGKLDYLDCSKILANFKVWLQRGYNSIHQLVCVFWYGKREIFGFFTTLA